MPRVVIIGAGLTGLATAFRLARLRADVDVTVLDAASRAGGNIGTRTDDGFTWEIGPNGFQDNKPSTLLLCKDLDLQSQLVAASEASRKNRYLCLDGASLTGRASDGCGSPPGPLLAHKANRTKLVKLPGSPEGILTTQALTWPGKLAMMREPFRRGRSKPGETVEAFAIRRFGVEAAHTIVDALVTGIHGGDPALLEVASAFPRLVQWEREAGSVLAGVLRMMRAKKRAALEAGLPKPGPTRLLSFAGGLQVLVDALTESLGPSVKLLSDVTSLECQHEKWRIHVSNQSALEADHVVLTTPAAVQARLLGSINAPLAAELAAIPSNRIAVVALGYRSADVDRPLDGFGYIAPQRTRRDVLGVQWCSSIFPGRAPEGYVLWRALVGGVHRGDLLDLDDATLIKRVHTEMQAVMHVTAEPVFARIQRWPRAIPQYVVGHGERVRRIRTLAARHHGLHLAGNAFDGIAMNDCTAQAELMALRIVTLLDPATSAG